MNKIIVTEEQLQKIFVWRDKNKDLVRSFKPYITDGELIIPNTAKIDFAFTPSGDDWKIVLKYYAIGYEYEPFYSASAMITDDGYVMQSHAVSKRFTSLAKADGNINTENARESCFGTLFAVNAYFFHYRVDISQLETKRVERHSKIVKGKYRYENVKVLERKYTIQGKIRNNKIPLHRAWHIDCWNVVGHIRHYKNGREIYIKPYKKGKNRNAETNNTYKIER